MAEFSFFSFFFFNAADVTIKIIKQTAATTKIATIIKPTTTIIIKTTTNELVSFECFFLN